MKLIVFMLASILFLSGCSGVLKPVTIARGVSVANKPVLVSAVVEPSEVKFEVKEEKILLEKGEVFAKTDFQGTMKTSYVKLIFVNVDNLADVHTLIVGDKTKQRPMGWNNETVEPGYFFIELAEGTYRITTVAIPVGSTIAEEEMDVTFEVAPRKVTYIGTLHMVGTRERIKLGGVPVIRPGFDYEVSSMNEMPEGEKIFSERYPDKLKQLITNIMKINKNKEGE